MDEFINLFLLLPIGVRFSILLIVPLIVWCIFARLIMKLISIIPFVIKRIVLLIYFVIEFPISKLHKMFGQTFYSIDQGVSNWFDKLSTTIEKVFQLLNKPKNLYKDKAFIIYILFAAYLIIPSLIGFNSKPFTFWYNFYINLESSIIEMFIKK